MLMIVMVGAAATVMLSTQEDLSVAGQDREQLQAFYAAEYGIAQAKDYLASLATTFFTNGSWNGLLTSTSMYLCKTSGVSPPTVPTNAPATNNPFTSSFKLNGNAQFTVGDNVIQYRWCVHNDAEDLAYTDLSNNGSGQTGDVSDLRDSFHQVVIESYGQIVNQSNSTMPLAASHLQVYVGAPNGTAAVSANCYGQSEGCGGHTASSGDTTAVLTGTTITQRSL